MNLNKSIASTFTSDADNAPIPTHGCGKKPLLIPDFVANCRSSCEKEENQLASDGQATLLLKTSKAAKPNPQEVSLPQWIGANARIQAELIKRGDLATADAQLRYTRCIVNLGDLAQTNTWASVMLYDHAFRKLQANERLTWDDVNNSWRLAFFTWRNASPNLGENNARPVRVLLRSSLIRDSRVHQICINYNQPAGCSFPGCRYAHCCLQPGYQAKHPHYQHHEKQDRPGAPLQCSKPSPIAL